MKNLLLGIKSYVLTFFYGDLPVPFAQVNLGKILIFLLGHDVLSISHKLHLSIKICHKLDISEVNTKLVCTILLLASTIRHDWLLYHLENRFLFTSRIA